MSREERKETPPRHSSSTLVTWHTRALVYMPVVFQFAVPSLESPLKRQIPGERCRRLVQPVTIMRHILAKQQERHPPPMTAYEQQSTVPSSNRLLSLSLFKRPFHPYPLPHHRKTSSCPSLLRSFPGPLLYKRARISPLSTVTSAVETGDVSASSVRGAA